MRGKRIGMAVDAIGNRIIPAHAGQTDDAVFSMLRHPDHPRACGANSASDWVEAWRTGSSPRMRGKRALCDRHGRKLRIIPAHAGQTRRCGRFSMPQVDHPRACGANVGEIYV